MNGFEVKNPVFDRDVRQFLTAMPVFSTLGLSIEYLSAGEADIAMTIEPPVTFDGWHVQGGIIGALLDIAGGASAFTLAPAGHGIATLGFDTQHLALAGGARLLAEGRVIKPGRNQSVSHVRIFAEHESQRTLCAIGHVTARWIELAA